MRVLITGGAGFIGRHLARELVREGYAVRVIDNLITQVHGNNPVVEKILPNNVEFIRGDVRNREILNRALDKVEIVFHFAAQTGVGQSMYEIYEYTDCNVGGTAQLLESLARGKGTVRRLILASSRAVYGEGKYSCNGCGVVYPLPRSAEQMDRRLWEVYCPNCSAVLEPLPTDESKPVFPGSVYAISKYAQEELCMCVGRAYDIPVVILRFFNVYGSGQSLGNPYTGIMTIFATRIISGCPPLIYEDGKETRDFVHVFDVVRACILAMNSDKAVYQVVNVGSGKALSILDMACAMIREMGVTLEPEIIGKYRVGDIRHCYADIRYAEEVLRYQPQVTFEDGLREFLIWAQDQHAEDKLAAATAELEKHGLFR